jgi:UDP-N-acetylglucosamine 2-epimerase (non-hydrolysing)
LYSLSTVLSRTIDFTRRVILVTGHRRESFGDGFDHICDAIAEIAKEYNASPSVGGKTGVQFVYPMHFNPHVREPVNRILKGIPNVFLIEPLDYSYLIWLMEKCYFVLTDSGGIQEEAPALGKPVLVMRDVTERQEGVEAGTARLVGTDRQKIVAGMRELLDNTSVYTKMANAVNPYGDGTTSGKIAKIIEDSGDETERCR